MNYRIIAMQNLNGTIKVADNITFEAPNFNNLDMLFKVSPELTKI